MISVGRDAKRSAAPLILWESPRRAMSLLRKYPFTTLVSITALLAYALPPLAAGLQLDLALACEGQWWRFWTGHITHYDGNHLFWDLVMFVVLGAACENRHPRRFATALALMMAGVSAAITVFPDEIVAYRGLSGVDTGLFVWFAADQIRQSIAVRDRLVAAIWIVPCVGLIAKLIWESMSGQMLFVDSASFRPLVESHLAGAVIGALSSVISIGPEPARPRRRAALANTKRPRGTSTVGSSPSR